MENPSFLGSVMLFVKSLGGGSQPKEEDTPDAALELSARAFYKLTRRTLAWAAKERSA